MFPSCAVGDSAAFIAAWQAAAAADARLGAWGLGTAPGFAFVSDGAAARFGQGGPRFTLTAPADVWAKALQAVPPRHHHSLATFARDLDCEGRSDVGCVKEA